MKTRTLKTNGFGQRFKIKLILLFINIALFNGACKKELYDNSIAPPSQKDRFLTELYNNLLKNDAQYHILDQLQPSDKLGWERMMVRYKAGKAASFNYVLPVIREGETTDKLLQFSFSSDNKLVNISLLSYNNNLRLPIASDPLSSSYVKNQQTANILACMSKDGLAVSDKLSQRASSITPLDMQKIATPENVKQARPQALMSLPNKAAGKPVSTNANIMNINYGSGCGTIVNFDFLYSYNKWVDINEYNLYKYAYNSYDYNPFDASVAQDFHRYFNEFLTNSEYPYEDRSTSYANEVIFFNPNQGWGAHFVSLVQEALQYAAQQTAFSQGHNMSIINYYIPRTSYNCYSSSGSGGGGIGSGDSYGNTPLIEIAKDSLAAKSPCAKVKILDELETIKGYNKMVEPFLQKGLMPTITWNANTQPWTSSNYSGGTTNISSSSGLGMSSDINLNISMLQSSSQLLIAAVAIHETYHAYVNYMFANNVDVTLINKSQPNYMAGLYQYIQYEKTGSSNNYTDHYNMLTSQYDNMTDILFAYGKGSYTMDECRKALLFGMNNPGPDPEFGQAQFINQAYTDLLNKYGYTATDVNDFQLSQINAPANKKLPTSGCQ